MKIFAGVLFVILSVLIASGSIAANDTTKEVCLTPFGMDWKNSEDAKTHLLVAAKREASGALFGELIRGVTEVNNFQLTRDNVISTTVGFVRVDGVPQFYNGQGFGEVCVKVNAKATDEDLAKFSPKSIKRKICIADPRLSLGEIRSTAEKQARVQAVRDFEPKLETESDESVLALIHESTTEGAGFIPETETYCVTAKGVVYPIELLALNHDQDTGKNKTKKVRAIKFDGKHDYANLNLKRGLAPSNIAIEFLMKWAIDPMSGNSWSLFFAEKNYGEDALRIQRDGSGGVEFSDRGSYLFTNQKLQQGRWYFVTAVYSNNTRKLYIDGNYMGEAQCNISGKSLDEFIIGGGAWGRFFNGSMAELRIWNRRLTEEEIKANIQKKLKGKEDGLVAYFNFSKISKILEVADASGNGNILTLVGNATVIEDDVP